MIIVPEKTAIANGVAKSANLIAEHIPVPADLLDYGAGRLRNTYFLLEKGFHVSILETPLQLERIGQQNVTGIQAIYSVGDQIDEKFSVVLCSFVLNVIPNPDIRSHVLTHCHELLKPSGKLFVEVRQKRGILSNKHKESYGDGYLIGNRDAKTFQKPFEKEEFKRYVSAHQFEVEHIQSTSDGWLIIAKKGDTYDS